MTASTIGLATDARCGKVMKNCTLVFLCLSHSVLAYITPANAVQIGPIIEVHILLIIYLMGLFSRDYPILCSVSYKCNHYKTNMVYTVVRKYQHSGEPCVRHFNFVIYPRRLVYIGLNSQLNSRKSPVWNTCIMQSVHQ